GCTLTSVGVIARNIYSRGTFVDQPIVGIEQDDLPKSRSWIKVCQTSCFERHSIGYSYIEVLKQAITDISPRRNRLVTILNIPTHTSSNKQRFFGDGHRKSVFEIQSYIPNRLN